jgi:3-deoxy-7-phosphoheptulonate synthase
VGWKGLINDPYLDESYRIDEGLRIARQLLIEINRLGLPAARVPGRDRRSTSAT